MANCTVCGKPIPDGYRQGKKITAHVVCDMESSLPRTRERNEFRREAIALGQRSPYRQSLYIEARLAGKDKDDALRYSRGE